MKLILRCLLIMVFSVIPHGTYAFLTNSSLATVTNSNNALAITINDHFDFKETNMLFGLNDEIAIDNLAIVKDHDADPDDIQRLRLQFSSEDGFKRPLLLAFTPDNAASDGFDYGYDALNPDQFPNDMFWDIEGNNYIIQGVGAFDVTKIYALNINIANAGPINITLTGLENFNSEIDVFIYDLKLNTYTQINSNDFTTDLNEGIHNNRFFITFRSKDPLSISESDKTALIVNYLIGSSEIYIQSLALMDVDKVHLINIIGQTLMTFDKQAFNTTGNEIRIPVEHTAQGTYMIKVETSNFTLNKKVLIK